MKSWTETCVLLARLHGKITAREYARRVAALRGLTGGFSWGSHVLLVVKDK